MMKQSASQRRTVTIKSVSRVRANVRYFLWDLALRNFVFYLRSNILLAAGCAVGALALAGALLAGSSLKASIRGLHDSRLGEVKWALSSPAGHIQKATADSISSGLKVLAAPVQLLTGSAGTAGGNVSVHRVNIIGADERFWALGPEGAALDDLGAIFRDSAGGAAAVVNAALARKLGIGAGNEIVLRFQRTGGLAPDAPFGRLDTAATLRLPVTSVAGAGSYGDFSLKAEHFTVYNVFVPLKLLQSVNNSPGTVSAILIGKPGGMIVDYQLDAGGDTDTQANGAPDAERPAPRPNPFGPTESRHVTVTEDEIMYTVRKNLGLKDAGLNIRAVDPGIDAPADRADPDFEIYSDRVFISEALTNTITGVIHGAMPVSSWFVNTIAAADSVTPYSFVSTPPVRYRLNDNQIALNSWTAKDLNASVGDTVTLTYFVPQPVYGLRTDTAKFVVSAIIENPVHNDDPPPVRYPRFRRAGYQEAFVPAENQKDTAVWLDRSLMPPYPGLAGAAACEDWNPSVPVDLRKIRLADEEYWGKFGGTPKAVISYARAMQIWGSRFGTATAIRIPRNAHVADNINVIHSADDFERAVAAALTPAACGIRLTDVRAAVDRAVNNGTDFTPLFTALSFFIFAAALILIWLLSTLQAKSRADEYKVLTAIGYSRKHVLSIYLSEGMITFGLGTAAGVILCPVYALFILHALKAVWHDAAHTPPLGLFIEPLPIIIGAAAAFVCALAGMMIPIWKSTRKYTDIRAVAKPEKESVAEKALDKFIAFMVTAYQRADTAVRSAVDACRQTLEMIKGPKPPEDIGIGPPAGTAADQSDDDEFDLSSYPAAAGTDVYKTASVAAGAAAGFNPAASAQASPGRYELTNGNPPPSQTPAQVFDKTRLIMLNILREKKRVFAEIMILACALLTLGIAQLFTRAAHHDPRNVSGGTGGFVLYGEFNAGVPRERTDAAFARERGVGVNEREIDFISVAMRMRDGGDASRLNLNRAETPALIGVDQNQFDGIGAFAFKSFTKDVDKKRPWQILGAPAGGNNTVYGIADASALKRGLGKSVGDKITYTAESGDTLIVIIAAALKNSILQGKVIIAETDFIKHYPSTSGYRALLLSMTGEMEKPIAGAFESYHEKNGLILEQTADRLNTFNAAGNAYLSIFTVLGVIGLMLGCLGMGIIVIRNMEDRRGELAMLMTLGFTSDAVRRMLFAEHAVVAAAGAAVGLLPTLLASIAALSWAAALKIFCLLTVALSCGAGAIMIGLQKFKGRELFETLREDG